MQDYTFSSIAAAASIVLGKSVNGLNEWKAENDKTYLEIKNL